MSAPTNIADAVGLLVRESAVPASRRERRTGERAAAPRGGRVLPRPARAASRGATSPDRAAAEARAAERRRARVGLLVPGSAAERASRSLIWLLVVVAVAIGATCDGVPAWSRVLGCAPPLLGVLFGYRWASGLRVRTSVTRVALAWGRPYLSWLLILGGPVLAWSAARGGDTAGWARRLAWGGAELGAPLAGHWLLAALAVAVVGVRLAENWLGVEPVWMLPAALALGYGGPVLVGLPLSLGIGASFVTYVLVGHALRLGRERVGWRTGLLLAAAGLALAAGPAGPLDVQAGVQGVPVVGPLAAGAAGAGMILLVERLARVIPTAPRHLLASVERLAVVALLTCGVGAFVTPASWPNPVAAALSLLVCAAMCVAVACLTRSAWLTGEATPVGTRARHCRRASRLGRLLGRRAEHHPGASAAGVQGRR